MPKSLSTVSQTHLLTQILRSWLLISTVYRKEAYLQGAQARAHTHTHNPKFLKKCCVSKGLLFTFTHIHRHTHTASWAFRAAARWCEQEDLVCYGVIAHSVHFFLWHCSIHQNPTQHHLVFYPFPFNCHPPFAAWKKCPVFKCFLCLTRNLQLG